MLKVVNADGSTETGSLIDEIVREGARRMLAAALEAGVNSYLAELAGARDEAGRRLIRNGFHAERTGPTTTSRSSGETCRSWTSSTCGPTACT